MFVTVTIRSDSNNKQSYPFCFLVRVKLAVSGGGGGEDDSPPPPSLSVQRSKACAVLLKTAVSPHLASRFFCP